MVNDTHIKITYRVLNHKYENGSWGWFYKQNMIFVPEVLKELKNGKTEESILEFLNTANLNINKKKRTPWERSFLKKGGG